MNDKLILRNKVKDLRKSKGLSQEDLATAVGTTKQTIISIEKEQYNPSLMLAYRMAEIFHVSVEELCCLKENKELEDQQYEQENQSSAQR